MSRLIVLALRMRTLSSAWSGRLPLTCLPAAPSPPPAPGSGVVLRLVARAAQPDLALPGSARRAAQGTEALGQALVLVGARSTPDTDDLGGVSMLREQLLADVAAGFFVHESRGTLDRNGCHEVTCWLCD